ncbi:MAG: hypothetical protein M1823_003621 [Watsoniomyces obsoletus]|nr:MAG: hypothetical protein M1823_003621 [Watsoniomyces obsoletus]
MEIRPPGPLTPPPPGVTSNFDAPNRKGLALWVVLMILLVLSTLFVAGRIYTRAVLMRALGWDDYICVLAWLVTIVATAMIKIMIDIGVGKRGWDIYVEDFRALFVKEAKARFALQFSYLWIMGLIKVSILLLYLRIFTVTRWFRWIVYGTTLVVAGMHLTCIILFLCQNRPLNGYWDPERVQETAWVRLDYVVLALGVVTIVTDLIVLILPIPIIWQLQMRMRLKLIVLAILLVGVIVTAASVWRLLILIQLLKEGPADGTQAQYQFYLANGFEINLAIMCACAPALQALVKKFAPRVLRLPTSEPGYSGGEPPSADQHRSRPHRHSKATSKVKPKWPQESQSQEDGLANLTYVELSERGKSDEYSNSNRTTAEP